MDNFFYPFLLWHANSLESKHIFFLIQKGNIQGRIQGGGGGAPPARPH